MRPQGGITWGHGVAAIGPGGTLHHVTVGRVRCERPTAAGVDDVRSICEPVFAECDAFQDDPKYDHRSRI